MIVIAIFRMVRSEIMVSTDYFLCRELEEECGLVAKELNPAGVLLFEMGNDPQLLEVHVFTTRKYSGTVTESEGMRTLLCRCQPTSHVSSENFF